MDAFCQANGQIRLPLVEWIEQARLTVSTVLDQVSPQTLAMILALSAEQIAEPRTPGRPSGEIRWHGSQAGRVSLDERQMSVRRPRLRQKGKRRGGEIEISACQALVKNPAMRVRMFEALWRGVSTRQYCEMLPRTAETVGVSKSVRQRESDRSERGATARVARAARWEEIGLLVIYIDGMQFGAHDVISAVGVDFQGVWRDLPAEQYEQVRSLLRAAYKLERAGEGVAKIKKMAQWLEREYPSQRPACRKD